VRVVLRGCTAPSLDTTAGPRRAGRRRHAYWQTRIDPLMVRQMEGAQQLPSEHGEPCLPQQMVVLGLVVVMPQLLLVVQHWVALVQVSPVITHAAVPPAEPPPAAPPPSADPPADPPADPLPPAAFPPAMEPPAAPPAVTLPPPALPPPAPNDEHTCDWHTELPPHARQNSPWRPHARSEAPDWQTPKASQQPVHERESHNAIGPPHEAMTNKDTRRKKRMRVSRLTLNAGDNFLQEQVSPDAAGDSRATARPLHRSASESNRWARR